MPAIINLGIIVFSATSVIFFIWDYIRHRNIKILMIEILLILLFIFFLINTTEFPQEAMTLGGASPLFAVMLTFVGILAGMVGNYFFYRGKKPFSWKSLLQPFFVSPIVLLPLIGTIQLDGQIESMQLISILLLAFQNGFFWKTIFDKISTQQ